MTIYIPMWIIESLAIIVIVPVVGFLLVCMAIGFSYIWHRGRGW